VRAGREPDTPLLGLNHLPAFGVAADVHDPRLLRRKRGGRLERFLWSARELPLPWELWWADVVFTPLANFFPLAARLHGAPPVVVVNYGLVTIYDRSSRARQKLLARSLRSAAAVICLGTSQRHDTIERCGLVPERVHTLPVGVDVDWFEPREVSGEPYVLTVGKDLARDLRTFAEAVAAIDAPVEIVAHPRNLADLVVPANARVRSFVSAPELRDLYAGAACVVVAQQPDGYPYGSEGGGLTTICEAMAMAKPVVATDRAILHDYLEDDELVPPGDPAALRAAIERVLADKPNERGPRSRGRAEQRHSTRHFAEKLAPILRVAAT